MVGYHGEIVPKPISNEIARSFDICMSVYNLLCKGSAYSAVYVLNNTSRIKFQNLEKERLKQIRERERMKRDKAQFYSKQTAQRQKYVVCSLVSIIMSMVWHPYPQFTGPWKRRSGLWLLQKMTGGEELLKRGEKLRKRQLIASNLLSVESKHLLKAKDNPKAQVQLLSVSFLTLLCNI